MAKKQTGAIDARHYDVVLAPHIGDVAPVRADLRIGGDRKVEHAQDCAEW